MPRITAYHVSGSPDLDVIKPHVCDSKHYDGLLFGAEVAAFTTTTRNGLFPDRSHYPRETLPGTVVYRYVMTFDPSHYDKFQMANDHKQVHYLLLSRRIASERWIASVLRRLLPERENKDWAAHFPDGAANDYDTDRPSVFVNVFFFHAVRVKLLSNDRVTRSAFQNARRDNDRRQDEWLLRLIEAATKRDETQDRDRDELADRLEGLLRM